MTQGQGNILIGVLIAFFMMVTVKWFFIAEPEQTGRWVMLGEKGRYIDSSTGQLWEFNGEYFSRLGTAPKP